MLWRARLTLPDRPGALATLASECGAAGVNILGLQVFPGIESVTDELVLEVPHGWEVDDILLGFAIALVIGALGMTAAAKALRTRLVRT